MFVFDERYRWLANDPGKIVQVLRVVVWPRENYEKKNCHPEWMAGSDYGDYFAARSARIFLALAMRTHRVKVSMAVFSSDRVG